MVVFLRLELISLTSNAIVIHSSLAARWSIGPGTNEMWPMNEHPLLYTWTLKGFYWWISCSVYSVQFSYKTNKIWLVITKAWRRTDNFFGAQPSLPVSYSCILRELVLFWRWIFSESHSGVKHTLESLHSSLTKS